jgi:hypothetical protein
MVSLVTDIKPKAEHRFGALNILYILRNTLILVFLLQV